MGMMNYNTVLSRTRANTPGIIGNSMKRPAPRKQARNPKTGCYCKANRRK